MTSIEKKDNKKRCPDFQCLYEDWNRYVCFNCGSFCEECSTFKDKILEGEKQT